MWIKTGKKILISFLVVLFWGVAWHLLALLVNEPYFLPSPYKTFLALFELLKSENFFLVIAFTLWRVVRGLLIGVTLALGVAILCNYFVIAKKIIAPFVMVMKAVPVAVYIILLYVRMSSDELTVFVVILMIFPVVWQNVLDGYSSIPKELTEVADVFEFNRWKRFKILTYPALKKYLVPAVITSVGLAFKAAIAAEIIAYTAVSIGQFINDAKYYYQTDVIFAWAIVIIILSYALESVTKTLLRRFSK